MFESDIEHEHKPQWLIHMKQDHAKILAQWDAKVRELHQKMALLNRTTAGYQFAQS